MTDLRCWRKCAFWTRKIGGGKQDTFFPGGDQRGGTLKKSGAPNLEEDGRMRKRKKGEGGGGEPFSVRTLIQ